MSNGPKEVKADMEEESFTREKNKEHQDAIDDNMPTQEEFTEFEDAYEIEDKEDRELIESQRKKRKSLLFDLVFYILLIFVVVYVIPNYVIQRTYVDGDSMLNSLHNGDQLYVEKLSYHFNALNRFDIIVFYPYGRKHDDYYVKRIIGLPGETVQIIGSEIFIDGKVLKEHYGKDPIDNPGRAINPIKLGSDEYFVLGDNRDISRDSRSTVVGNVKKENIGGKAIFRILPMKRFGTID